MDASTPTPPSRRWNFSLRALFVSITLAAFGAGVARYGIQYFNDMNVAAKELGSVDFETIVEHMDSKGWRPWVPMVCFLCAGAAFGLGIGALSRRYILHTSLGVVISLVATIVWSAFNIVLLR